MVNLSERGAFLKTALPFSVGRRMYLGWNLPGAVMVRTEATVVWTTNGGPSLPVPGMGVQFVDVVEGGEFLEKYLKERNTAGE
jgi:Tfp pilus assembly protein PilZ